MSRFGLLGRSLEHSHSPAIHRLFGSWPYELFQREPKELASFLLEEDWNGLNVTIPYKKAVIPFCHELSPLAQRLGSVNTLIKRADGTIYGDNTDFYGFQQMALKLGTPYHGKKALVLGSGGASATVQAVLKDMGCQVTVISRSGPNHYGNLHRHGDASVLVNTTPVGMYPNNGASPLCLQGFPHLEAVLDLVYNPARTRLLQEAEALGLPCLGGLFMLVCQAARASEQFTGAAISREMLESVFRHMERSMENLILIGMPGCGKSTVGRILAQALGRDFVDTDSEVEAVIGMPIPRYIRENGEDAFRAAETAVLERLGKQWGLVIATGGGCVTRVENYSHLYQNGRIIWLHRSLDSLPVNGRPVSQRDGIYSIYAARKAQYRRFSHMDVSNDGTPEETALQIMEAIGK